MLLNKIRKNKKGFTMVEIIVVLVILAILVGALTPTMIGFINEARGKALVAEARTGMMAVQVVIAETPAAAGESAWMNAPATGGTAAYRTKFSALASDVITAPNNGVFTNATADSLGHVTGITYTKGQDWITIAGGSVTTGRNP